MPRKPQKITVNKASLSSGGVAQDSVASRAGNNSLSVAKDGGNVVATYTKNIDEYIKPADAAHTLALDVHEERVGALNEALLLVLGSLSSERRIQQINGQLGRISILRILVCLEERPPQNQPKHPLHEQTNEKVRPEVLITIDSTKRWMDGW